MGRGDGWMGGGNKETTLSRKVDAVHARSVHLLCVSVLDSRQADVCR
jgi:hypothetical protein